MQHAQGCPRRFVPNNGFLRHKWIGLFISVFISLSWGYFCIICIFTCEFDFIIGTVKNMKNPLLLPWPTRTRAGWPCISSNMLVWIFCSPLHAGVQIGTSHIHTHIHTYTYHMHIQIQIRSFHQENKSRHWPARTQRRQNANRYSWNRSNKKWEVKHIKTE